VADEQDSAQSLVNFPTTDDYRIAVDVDLSGSNLRAIFAAAAEDRLADRFQIQFVNRIVGRDLVIESPPDNAVCVDDRYWISADSIDLDDCSKENSIAFLIQTAIENLPPHIPDHLSADVLKHLAAIHEAEHATQRVSGKDNNIFSTVRGDLAADSSVYNSLLREADADFAVLKYLDTIGETEIRQFWLDARTISSFVAGRPGQGHDVSFMLQNFQENRSVIDPVEFLEQKGALTDRIEGLMGLNESTVTRLYSQYHQLGSLEDADRLNMFPAPQRIGGAVQHLLAYDDTLTPLQRVEAQNCLSALDRLGYDINPDFSYENQIHQLAQSRGWSPAGQSAEALPQSTLLPKSPLP
jgi:hypothetical protein